MNYMDKMQFWKDATKEFPPIDKEVIALAKVTPESDINDYKVVFAHRPDPKGWYGKSIFDEEGESVHYTPMTYDVGGWNQPDIIYWLDIDLPN